MKDHLSHMPALAKALGMPTFRDDGGLDALLPYFEKMRQEGAVVILKLDGQRRGDDADAYTALVSGGHLGDDYIRTDSKSLTDAAIFIVVEYARQCWNLS
jgi:hypothetical protein